MRTCLLDRLPKINLLLRIIMTYVHDTVQPKFCYVSIIHVHMDLLDKYIACIQNTKRSFGFDKSDAEMPNENIILLSTGPYLLNRCKRGREWYSVFNRFLYWKMNQHRDMRHYKIMLLRLWFRIENMNIIQYNHLEVY